MNTEPVLERLARVEGRVEEHSRMVEDIAGRFTNLEARFDRAEANINARFERVDARLDHLDRKIDGVRDGLGGKIDVFQREIDGKLTRYFTWMVGLTLASWLSMMFRTFPAGH